MVTKRLLGLIRKALRHKDIPTGSLLIQSNCEDVAVFMRKMACAQVGFEFVEPDIEDEFVIEPESTSKERARIPRRTLDWISMGGERAKGKGWSTRPILPRIGRTETEVACMINNTPVYRCLLRAAPIETK
jgi:hypothetical protein